MKRAFLFELAEQGRLPLHQYIDVPTVRWIKNNRPALGASKRVSLPARKDVERFAPESKWFCERKIVDSIHGFRHTLRVVALVVLVVSERSYPGRIENLLIAAALHDVGRRNDKGDPQHGLRAARWFKKNIAVVEKKFKIKLTTKDINEIYWTIAFHELPKNTIEKNKNYTKFKNGADILRMADALDRYRLPRTKWWINEKILGCRVPLRFKQAAFDLVVKSEQRYVRGESSKKSVLNNFA